MNILWICNDNTANIPYTIKNGINSLTDHNCKLIQSMLTQLRYPIDGTIIAHDITLKQFKSYIDKARSPFER
jgi:hypothetical protein